VKPPGKALFTTRIFFPDAPQNKKDPAFRSELAMKVTAGRDGQTATFDIVLNL
jgi:protocatechuate 3,4-dioxygenase beta subunit